MLVEVLKKLRRWKTLHKLNAMSALFPNIMTANIHTHTLSFEIICLVEIEKVEVFLADNGSTLRLTADATVEIDYSDEKLWELADKICESVEYFLQDEMRLFGPASAIFPLRVAYKVLSKDFEGNQDRIRRCQGLIGRVRERGISAIPHFPAGFLGKRSSETFPE